MAAGNRSTRIRLVEYLELGDDHAQGGEQVFKTLPNVKLNYGQKFCDLKKMIEISLRLRPDDPTYSIEQIRIKTKGEFNELNFIHFLLSTVKVISIYCFFFQDGDEVLDQESLENGQVQKIPTGNKVSLKVSSTIRKSNSSNVNSLVFHNVSSMFDGCTVGICQNRKQFTQSNSTTKDLQNTDTSTMRNRSSRCHDQNLESRCDKQVVWYRSLYS